MGDITCYVILFLARHKGDVKVLKTGYRLTNLKKNKCFDQMYMMAFLVYVYIRIITMV